MAKYILLVSVSIIICLAFGWLCWSRADRIIQFYRNQYASSRFLRSPIVSPFRWGWESEYAEMMIRLCGVFAILLAIFLAFVMVRGLWS